MQFLNDLGLFHYNGKEIPCIVEKGAPTHQTEGAIGVLYMDSGNGNLYKCVAADSPSKTYNWVIIGAYDAEETRLAVEAYLTQNPIDGAGLTSAEKSLMLTLFKNIPYTGDVSAAYKSLETLWNTGSGDSGGEDSGVTHYTVTQNLTKVTSDFSGTSLIAGAGLTVVLTADINTTFDIVTVTMGGEDITESAYSGNQITIPSVTGDVVITAVAVEASYTQVEYLEATATNTAILTSYALKATDLIECEFGWNGGSAQWAFPFSLAGGLANNDLIAFATRFDGVAGRTSYSRRTGTYTDRNTADADFAMPATEAKYRFMESIPGTGTIYDSEGNELITLADESVSAFAGGTYKIGLFGFFEKEALRGDATVAPGLRIYSFKVRNTYGTAVLDVIAVLDSNNVACMYDKISGEYLYDTSGANALTTGGVV